MLPSAVHRAIAAALLLAYIPGCVSWRVQSVPAAQLFADRPPDRVRVDRHDGSRLTLINPRLSGDTLVGIIGRDTTRIPLDAVRRLAVERGDALQSVGLIGLIIGGLVALMAATSSYSLGPS